MSVRNDFLEIDISTFDVGIDQLHAHPVADIHSLEPLKHLSLNRHVEKPCQVPLSEAPVTTVSNCPTVRYGPVVSTTLDMHVCDLLSFYRYGPLRKKFGPHLNRRRRCPGILPCKRPYLLSLALWKGNS
jgi:hypothetical protein